MRLNSKTKAGHFLPNPFTVVRGEKGIAMLIAILAMTIMVFLATEVSYDTSVEYVISSQQVNRLKAKYAAKAGVQLSLLRIAIYKKVIYAYGSQLGDSKSMLDPIWQFPLSWPPSASLPEEMSGVDKDLVKSAEKESMMKSQFFTTIESEGGKIDINDLASPSKSLADGTKKQILQIFLQKVETDEAFRNNFGSYNFEELVNNLADWVDEDRESRNGGDESAAYPDSDPEYTPPNQSFKTMSEIHRVAKMQDELFNILEKRITVYGTKGVNINYSPAEVLSALDPQMSEDVVQAVLKRRSDPNLGGPFANEKDFLAFVAGEGVRTDSFNADGIPLVFDAEYNFRIKSTGVHGQSQRDIEVITYDFEQIQERLIGFLDEEEKKKSGAAGNPAPGSQAGQTSPNPPAQPGQSSGSATSGNNKNKPPQGRPNIVFWNEN